MAEKIIQNVGRLANTTSADAGYFSEEAVNAEVLRGTELLVPPERQKHGVTAAASAVNAAATTPTAKEQMRERLRSETGAARYKMRKAIVEPVFGQLKEVRGIRRFSLRGLANAHAEFALMAATHNLLKLFRYGTRPEVCPAGA
jgi:hypothetical protein